MFNPLTDARRFLIPTLVSSMLMACGGGGGTTTTVTSPRLTYSGSEDPVVITTTNANDQVANLMSSSDAALLLSLQGTQSTPAASQESSGVIAIASKVWSSMETLGEGAATTGSANYRVAAISFNEVDSCDGNIGTYSVVGNLSDSGVGTLAMTMNNCSLDGELFNGTVELDIFSFDTTLDELLTARITFESFSVSNTAEDFVLSGTMDISANYSTQAESATLNLVIRDEVSGEMFKTDDLVIINQYDYLLAPSNYQQTINGRVYHSVDGYVRVTTLQPLAFSSLFVSYPDLGGSLLFTGASGGTITATSLSADYVEISVDVDGDTIAESTNTLLWSDLD